MRPQSVLASAPARTIWNHSYFVKIQYTSHIYTYIYLYMCVYVCVYIWIYNKYLQLAWKSTKNCLWCHCNILWANFASLPPTPLWAEMPLPAPGTGFQSFIQYIIALCIHPPAYNPSPFDGTNTLRKGCRHFRNDIWMRNGVGCMVGEGEGSLVVLRSLLLSLRLKFYNKFVTKIDLCAINDKNEKKTSS